jgi:hypothetical protein
MTEEEKKRAQELSDLRNTAELFGLNKSLDELTINSKEDYQTTINVLDAKINQMNVRYFITEFLN